MSTTNGGIYYTTVEAYTPATNTWTTVRPMPTGRQQLSAVGGAGRTIYAMGGNSGAVNWGEGHGSGGLHACEQHMDHGQRARWTTAAAAAIAPDGIFACPWRHVQRRGAERNRELRPVPQRFAQFGPARYHDHADGHPVRAEIHGERVLGHVRQSPCIRAADDNRHDDTTGNLTSVLAFAPPAGVPNGAYYTVTARDCASGYPVGVPFALGVPTPTPSATATASATSPPTDTPTATALASLGWHAEAPMPVARNQIGAVAGTDGRIYVMGGNTDTSSVANVEAYTASANTWTELAPLPNPVFGLAGAAGLDGRVYAIGGSGFGPAVWAYTPATNTWAEVASMGQSRENAAAVTAPDGRIYVFGGDMNGKVLGSVERYDPTANTWTTLASMPTWRSGPGASFGSDGRIYVMGDPSASTSTTCRQSRRTRPAPTRGRPSRPCPRNELDSSPSPRPMAASTRWEGHREAAAITVRRRHTPQTDTWVRLPGLPASTAAGAAIGPDGRIYAMGGDRAPC